jgi:hypothetical protein
MKGIVAALTLALRALATPVLESRDISGHVSILTTVLNSMKDFDGALAAYQGGPPIRVHESAVKFIKTIKEQTTQAKNECALREHEVDNLKPLAQQFNEAGKHFLQQFATRKNAFARSGLCEHAFHYVEVLGM